MAIMVGDRVIIGKTQSKKGSIIHAKEGKTGIVVNFDINSDYPYDIRFDGGYKMSFLESEVKPLSGTAKKYK